MRRIFILFFALFTLLQPFTADAREIEAVKAEGTAVRSDDAADVKRKAIDQALKNAVGEALESLLAKESADSNLSAVEPAITASPRSFILNYRILSEGWINHMDQVPAISENLPEGATQATGTEVYHIWIEASIDNAALLAEVTKLTAVAGFDNEITLNILGVRDFKTYREIKSSLERIATIKDLSYESFLNGRIVLTARTSGSARALTERIAKEVSEYFAVIEGSETMIVIKPSGAVTE